MTPSAIVCDLNSKKWLSLEEAITYIGFGSRDVFQKWREGIQIAGKTRFLTYYKTGKVIIYKRTDLDTFLEYFKQT